MLRFERVIYQEIFYKLDIIIEYLKNHDGENFKLYNYISPSDDSIPDSNIVDFAKELKDLILELTIITND